MRNVAGRIVRKLREARHQQIAGAILDTPPRKARDDGVIILSMVGTGVVLPYLVAAKSLHAQLDRGRFAILDDGTLTLRDKALLAEHLDQPEIHAIEAVDVGNCPHGGCWERLLLLLALRRDAYVIQLDSDTVTLGPVPEVAGAIAAGRDFTLRGGNDARWLRAADYTSAIDLDTAPKSVHVQLLAEASLDRIDVGFPGSRRYVRGCAGFAGFAAGGWGREIADRYSREAAQLLGFDRWSEWGSEQVMSNLIIANEGEPVLLPYDRYCNFWNDPVPARASFVHFVGTFRFHGGAYTSATERAIAALRV